MNTNTVIKHIENSQTELVNHNIYNNIKTIDDLKLEKLDFIKLDIEGYEQFAILGGLESIKKFKPVITLESWLNHKGQININETKKRYINLIDLGYEFHHIWGPDFLFIPK